MIAQPALSITEAAREFFRTRLQGTTMSATTEQGQVKVHFTGGTWKEIKRGIKSDPLKAEMVPHMPDIIATGQYRKRDLHKKRDDRTVAFHEYSKVIQTSQGPREVIVDVAERESAEPRFNIYNLTREGGQGYAKRVSHDEKENDVISVSSGSSLIMRDNAVSFDKNIEPFFEVVNLRFAEEGQQTDRPQTGVSDKNNHAIAFDYQRRRQKGTCPYCGTSRAGDYSPCAGSCSQRQAGSFLAGEQDRSVAERRL